MDVKSRTLLDFKNVKISKPMQTSLTYDVLTNTLIMYGTTYYLIEAGARNIVVKNRRTTYEIGVDETVKKVELKDLLRGFKKLVELVDSEKLKNFSESFNEYDISKTTSCEKRYDLPLAILPLHVSLCNTHFALAILGFMYGVASVKTSQGSIHAMLVPRDQEIVREDILAYQAFGEYFEITQNAIPTLAIPPYVLSVSNASTAFLASKNLDMAIWRTNANKTDFVMMTNADRLIQLVHELKSNVEDWKTCTIMLFNKAPHVLNDIANYTLFNNINYYEIAQKLVKISDKEQEVKKYCEVDKIVETLLTT